MMIEIALDADEEWDSSTSWDALVRSAAEAAVAESAYPELATGPRSVEISVRLTSDDSNIGRNNLEPEASHHHLLRSGGHHSQVKLPLLVRTGRCLCSRD